MGERRPAVGGLTTVGSRPPLLVMLAAGQAKRYGGCKPLAPVGLHGEAVIDLNAGDAFGAGFGEVVLVLGPSTGPAIAYHVQRCWPERVAVSFAEQPLPLGTAHAVLCARSLIGERPFAVINSDDVYGAPALTQLFEHLSIASEHALVAYRLQDTVVTSDPVTRGICHTADGGWLRDLVERRRVTRHGDGSFTCDDGLEPRHLSGDTPVSMNLWGFSPAIWPVLHQAVRRAHPGLADDGSVPGADSTGAEVLLPEVVGAMAGGGAPEGSPSAVRVLAGSGRCIGVTHANDLPVVRTELAEMVGKGLRPEDPWETMR